MSTHKTSITVLLSDVNSSPQLLRVLRDLQSQINVIEIVFFGSKHLNLATKIEELDLKIKYISRKSKLKTLFDFFTVASILLRSRPERVLASGQIATVIGITTAKLLKVKHRVFIRHHSVLHHEENMRLGLVLDKLTNRAATNIIAVSKVVEQILICKENVPKEKVIVIPNGIEIENYRTRYQQKTLRANYSISAMEKFEIGVISRMTDWKGVEYTAKAFVELQKFYPQTFLRIVGAFSDSYSKIMDILAELDSNSFSVESENMNIPHFLSNLDLFIHVPVNHEVEAFGLVYLEALASKVPCIFTISGIINQLEFPDKYVHLVAFKNSNDILIAIKKILSSNGCKKQKVPGEWIDQFDLETMSNRYLKVIIGN